MVGKAQPGVYVGPPLSYNYYMLLLNLMKSYVKINIHKILKENTTNLALKWQYFRNRSEHRLTKKILQLYSEKEKLQTQSWNLHKYSIHLKHCGVSPITGSLPRVLSPLFSGWSFWLMWIQRTYLESKKVAGDEHIWLRSEVAKVNLKSFHLPTNTKAVVGNLLVLLIWGFIFLLCFSAGFTL